MPETLANRSAVVTGSARGIGYAIASRLIRDGWAVVMTDLDGDAVSAAAAELGAAAWLVQDVRDPQSHRDAAREAAQHGELKAWFNNAGVGNDGLISAQTEDEIRLLVEVNMLGLIWGTRAALEAFGDGGGDIVNTGSMSSHGPVPGLGVYAATKAAVVSLTMTTQLETPSKVRAHAFCPDSVDTKLLRDMDDRGMGKQLTLSGSRLMTADEVADAAVGLIGSRRVVRSIPTWRAVLQRAGALTPSTSGPIIQAFAMHGRRVLKRSSGVS